MAKKIYEFVYEATIMSDIMKDGFAKEKRTIIVDSENFDLALGVAEDLMAEATDSEKHRCVKTRVISMNPKVVPDGKYAV